MSNYDTPSNYQATVSDNHLNNQQYINYAYEKNLLSEQQERALCRQMEAKLTQFLSCFTHDQDLLELLKDFILNLELDASRSSLPYLGRQDPHSLNLIGTIDELQTLQFIDDKRRTGLVSKRLKSKLSRWRPPTHSIAKAFLADDSLESKAPKQIKVKLKRLKASYFRHRNEMVQSNLRLVLSVASKYRHLGTPYDDLVQEGNMGLIKAIEHFDYDKGYRFSTYAYRIIGQSVHLAVDKNSSLVRRPFKMMRDKKVVEKIRNELEQRFGKQPRVEEVRKSLPKQVDNLQDLLHHSISVSADYAPDLIAEEGYAPDVADARLVPLEDQSAQTTSSNLVKDAIENQSEREQMILRMKHGIGLRKEYTLDEIGAHFGLSRERIRQIYLKSVDNIKASINPESH